jgi:hypothetical protein
MRTGNFERWIMALKKVISADDAVALIRDGDVVASSGYGVVRVS